MRDFAVFHGSVEKFANEKHIYRFIVGKKSSARLRTMRPPFFRQTGLLNKKKRTKKNKKEKNYAETSNEFHFQIFQEIRAAYFIRLNSICSGFPFPTDIFLKYRFGKPDRRDNFHFGNFQCSLSSALLDLHCKLT